MKWKPARKLLLSESSKINNLRKSFTAMLFALVVATLAERFGDILFIATEGWSQPIVGLSTVENYFKDDWLLLTSFSHSFLGLFLVSVSWVGWSKSLAKGHQRDVSGIFSLSFILLLLEVMLVVLYFVLSTSNELDVSSYHSVGMPVIEEGKQSALPEASILVAIFFLYFLWDVFADVLDSPLEESVLAQKGKCFKFKSFFSGILTHGFVSILCMVLCCVVYYLSTIHEGSRSVVLMDLSLIIVVAFFRSAKALESFFVKCFPWEITRKHSERSWPLQSEQIDRIFILAILYIVTLFLSCWLK